MAKRKIMNTLVFDRSDPHQVVTINADGTKTTRIQGLLQESNWCRKDMAMVNFANGDQKVVYLGEDGQPIWNGLKQYFSKSEIKELHEIGNRILTATETYPLMGVYLLGRD